MSKLLSLIGEFEKKLLGARAATKNWGSGTADFKFGGMTFATSYQPHLRQIRSLRCLTLIALHPTASGVTASGYLGSVA